MKLKLLSTAAVASGILFQSQVHAQSVDFEGLLVGVNTSVVHSSTKYSGEWGGLGIVSQSARKLTGGVDVSYSKAFGKSMLFGVGHHINL